MELPYVYVVQIEDSFGFDFGGTEGGIAQFKHKGDAYAFADMMRNRSRKTTRVVISRGKQRGKVEFVCNGGEALIDPAYHNAPV